LTSRVTGLLAGEFVLQGWQSAGLNVPSAVKRGLYTLEDLLIVRTVGGLSAPDLRLLEQSLRTWLALT
jgi:mRNA interferase MazF